MTDHIPTRKEVQHVSKRPETLLNWAYKAPPAGIEPAT